MSVLVVFPHFAATTILVDLLADGASLEENLMRLDEECTNRCIRCTPQNELYCINTTLSPVQMIHTDESSSFTYNITVTQPHSLKISKCQHRAIHCFDIIVALAQDLTWATMPIYSWRFVNLLAFTRLDRGQHLIEIS